MLKAGQIVKIYQKSISRQDYEGKAELVSEYRADETLPIWRVQFEGDEPGETYLRTIHIK